MCKALLWTNIGIFLIQIFATPPDGQSSAVQLWFQLDRSTLSGQVWRLITYGFLHSTSNFFHIIFNMLTIFFFGRPLERQIGSREFLAFYLVAIVAAGLAHLGIELMTGGIIPAIGASGGTLAILVLFALRQPRLNLLPPNFPFRLEVRWLALIVVISDLFPVLEIIRDKGQGVSDGVAHAAHMGGVIFAFLYFKGNLRLAAFFNKVSPVRPKQGGGSRSGQQGRPRPKKGKAKLSINGLSKAEIDEQMDVLLQKVNEQGIQSLTDKERKFMEDASEKFGR